MGLGKLESVVRCGRCTWRMGNEPLWCTTNWLYCLSSFSLAVSLYTWPSRNMQLKLSWVPQVPANANTNNSPGDVSKTRPAARANHSPLLPTCVSPVAFYMIYVHTIDNDGPGIHLINILDCLIEIKQIQWRICRVEKSEMYVFNECNARIFA